MTRCGFLKLEGCDLRLTSFLYVTILWFASGEASPSPTTALLIKSSAKRKILKGDIFFFPVKMFCDCQFFKSVICGVLDGGDL